MKWNHHHNNCGFNIFCNQVWTQCCIYFLRVVPGSCSETCPVLSHGGNEVVIMRVEEEVDVKEEDIPVAVKFSTAKVKCRSHSDQATQCCCVPINITRFWHLTVLMIQHYFLAIHSSSDYYDHLDIASWTPACETNVRAHALRPCPMYVIAIPPSCHSHYPLALSAPIPKQYTPTIYVTPFRLLDPDDKDTMVLWYIGFYLLNDTA